METKELMQLLVFVIILVIMVGGVILLLSGKGAEVLSVVRDSMRFGR